VYSKIKPWSISVLPRTRYGIRLLLALATVIVAVSACGSLGPKTLDKDQLDYGNSIGNNWKNQMLANIVKLRFVDMPVFVDVGSIVSGYSLQTRVSGRMGFGDSFTGGDSQGLGAGGTYTDRPTITYMPKTGDAYLRSLLEPVEPRNLLALIQAGYNAELLFTWAVEGINGIRNYSVVGAGIRTADPEFYEFTGLLKDLQSLGAVGFELEYDPETQSDIIFVLKKDGFPDAVAAKRNRMGEIMELDGTRDRFRVLYAPFKTDSATLAIQTRSVLQMLGAMSGFVEVPAELSSHTMPGYVLPDGLTRPFRVLSGPGRPETSFAEVKYQGNWFWIENSDLNSKRVFTLMLFLTTLTNQASSENAPVLTIPTG
jgi:hypothetical protein